MRDKKNLILGLWTRHPFWPLEPFIASLRRTTFDGDVCVFVDDVPTDTVASLQAHGVIVLRAGPSGQPRMPALSSRFFSYLDFLAARSEHYANVMLTDLRDVVFQSDPFGMPLPADIVFAQERCRLGDSPVNYNWLAQGYGEAVAHNMRDCLVSCAGTTFGSTAGTLRYLVAMARELSSRMPPLGAGIDQAVHNYIVHMHPLCDAWLDTTDSLVATMHFVPDASVQFSSQGVLIDGKLVPVLHQWERNTATREYIESAPQFKLVDPPEARTVAPPGDDAVLAYYHRDRDAAWLPWFLGSLRCVGFVGDIHCIGEFNADELQTLSKFSCTVHTVAASDILRAENVAHFYIAQLLDKLAESTRRPDQVLAFDSMRAVFPRDPFLGKTIGLSVFSEGPTQLGESDYNVQRLALFTSPDPDRLQRPIVSSSLLRGTLEVMRLFYHRLLIEFVGRGELLGVRKVVQGAVNKLCHQSGLAFPIIVHPNGAEAYFDHWPSGLAIDTKQGVRIGGTVPAVIKGEQPESELLRALRIHLHLAVS